jgi:hypothetical protein
LRQTSRTRYDNGDAEFGFIFFLRRARPHAVIRSLRHIRIMTTRSGIGRMDGALPAQSEANEAYLPERPTGLVAAQLVLMDQVDAHALLKCTPPVMPHQRSTRGTRQYHPLGVGAHSTHSVDGIDAHNPRVICIREWAAGIVLQYCNESYESCIQADGSGFRPTK